MTVSVTACYGPGCENQTYGNKYCSNSCKQRSYRMRRDDNRSYVVLRERERIALSEYLNNFAGSGLRTTASRKPASLRPFRIEPERWRAICEGQASRLWFDEVHSINFHLAGLFNRALGFVE